MNPLKSSRTQVHKRLILHIGRPKTGSTAIQSYLAANAVELQPFEITLAQTGYFWGAHGPLAWSLYKEAASRSGNEYWETCQEWAVASEMRAGLWQELVDEVSTSPYRNVIVSSEELGVLPATLESTQEILAEWLRGLAVTIVIYVRRQDALIESVYNQAVKGKEQRFAGSIEDFEHTVITTEDSGFDHYLICERWARTFGQESVIVRPFERQQLTDGLHIDFFKAIGIVSDKFPAQPMPDTNPELNRSSLEAMRRLNSLTLDAEIRATLLQRLHSIDASPPSQHSMLSPARRLRILDRFKESNAELARKFLGRKDGRLFFDPEPRASDPWEPVPPEEVALTLEMLSDIVPVDALVSEIRCTSLASDITAKEAHEMIDTDPLATEPREVPIGQFAKVIWALPSRSDDSARAHFKLLMERIKSFQANGGRVLSLDVFDTVLLRDDKSEARRFWELARLTAAQASENEQPLADRQLDHYIARNMGLELSYRARPAVDGCREGHIDEALNAQVRLLNLADRFTEEFRQIELDHEHEHLLVNQPLMELAEQFAAGGGKVIFVSDMYLPARDIAQLCRRMLKQMDFVYRIYSSADCIVSKRSGLLFGLIEKEMDFDAREFLHIGDSIQGDFRMPKMRGWHAQLFPVARVETCARIEDLAATIQEISTYGFDPSRWAKV